MELTKAILRLDFVEALDPWLELRSLLREAAEKPAAEIQGGPLIIDVPEKKQRVELHLKSLVIQVEAAGSLDQATTAISTKLETLNRVGRFRRVKTWSCEAHFINSYALPFHELLLLVRRTFLQENAFSQNMTDVALIFDELRDGIMKHTQVGPMDKEQLLRTFLVWSRSQLPDDFVFVASKYEANREIDYSSGYLEQFLSDATAWQTEMAGSVFNHMSRKGA